jgi:CHAD domain-containing protein
MAKQLRNTEAGTQGVRRILRQQTRQALEALNESQLLSDEVVHEVRKQLKNVRAALRLLRKALGSRIYDRENAFFRDVARPLTEVRDAKILMDTLGQLTEHCGDQANALDLDQVRRALQEHYQEIRQPMLEEDRLRPIKDALQTALTRVKQWPLSRRGWSVLGVGLKRIYRQGRDAFATAQENPSEENLHEWRKQVKYLWHQLQMLRPLQPALIKALADQAHTLADYLGDDHDLAVLHQKLLAEPDRFPDYATVNALAGLIGRRRAELQEQAEALGHRLYEEKPKRFVGRFQGYWHSWREKV